MPGRTYLGEFQLAIVRQLALDDAVLKSLAELAKYTAHAEHCGGARRLIRERHTMIATMQHGFPQLSLRQLCRWLGVGRSWYYARPSGEARRERYGAV